MTPFRWKNCYADVASSKHDLTIKAFLTNVILPAIQSLEARIAELGQNDDPADRFEQFDMEEVLAETKLAFCLACQSIWERQLRSYLSRCGEELYPGEGFARRAEKADWPKLCVLFRQLRGIRLEAFPSFPELDTLQHLGNACRHGDGSSSEELFRRCPDWWPSYTPMPSKFGSMEPPRRTVASMTVPTDRLEGFVWAIAVFWDDTTYIYNESIERKHPALEAELVRARAERSWHPTQEEHGIWTRHLG